MLKGSDMGTTEVALLGILRADVKCPSYYGGVIGRSGRETSKNMRKFLSGSDRRSVKSYMYFFSTALERVLQRSRKLVHL
jgi:hypothetical protein